VDGRRPFLVHPGIAGNFLDLYRPAHIPDRSLGGIGAVNILALDQGTSATKALVVRAEGTIAAMAERPVRSDSRAPGHVEIDPAELLASVRDAGRAALDEAAEPVGAVALANQGETVLAWDRATGLPLSRCLVWQDRRAVEVCGTPARAGSARPG
jgi:glycerol kinase